MRAATTPAGDYARHRDEAERLAGQALQASSGRGGPVNPAERALMMGAAQVHATLAAAAATMSAAEDTAGGHEELAARVDDLAGAIDRTGAAIDARTAA